MFSNKDEVEEMLIPAQPSLRRSVTFADDKMDQWGVFMKLPISAERRPFILEALRKANEETIVEDITDSTDAAEDDDQKLETCTE